MGSGKLVEEVVAAERNPDRKDLPRPHLISPASEIYLRLANADLLPQANADGEKRDRSIVGTTWKLVRSPVVIAMWKEKAEALGWDKGPEKAPSWAKILDLVRSKDGWKDYDFEDFGRFVFGHTNPSYSNSGLIAIIAQVYAAVHKTSDLTIADVRREETRRFLADIARSVSQYGESTGTFGKKMLVTDPKEFHAAVLYENMVIQSYDSNGNPRGKEPIVAIYPSEGTFWSDHPVGVVDAWWMDDEHREAADIYIQYLRQKPQQVVAMEYGFRPGVESVALTARFSKKFGVSPDEPKKVMEVPDLPVIAEILNLWRQIKKKSNVVLAIDISNSMERDNKIGLAKEGSARVIEVLGDEDRLSILSFGDEVTWERKGLSMDKKVEAVQVVKSLKTQNRTSLYDGVLQAYQGLLPQAGPGQISAVIVLSDGRDTVSKIDFARLQQRVQFDRNRPVIIITIAYGNDADPKVLQEIADLGRGEFHKSTPLNIKEIMEKAAAAVSAGPAVPARSVGGGAASKSP